MRDGTTDEIHEASLFFRLVRTLCAGSILITTNKGSKDWPEVLPGNEILATAILDRLLHHSHARAQHQGSQLPPARPRAGDQSQAVTDDPRIPSSTVRNNRPRLNAQNWMSLAGGLVARAGRRFKATIHSNYSLPE